MGTDQICARGYMEEKERINACKPSTWAAGGDSYCVRFDRTHGSQHWITHRMFNVLQFKNMSQNDRRFWNYEEFLMVVEHLGESTLVPPTQIDTYSVCRWQSARCCCQTSWARVKRDFGNIIRPKTRVISTFWFHPSKFNVIGSHYLHTRNFQRTFCIRRRRVWAFAKCSEDKGKIFWTMQALHNAHSAPKTNYFVPYTKLLIHFSCQNLLWVPMFGATKGHFFEKKPEI